jgi:hypothetical protein
MPKHVLRKIYSSQNCRYVLFASLHPMDTWVAFGSNADCVAGLGKTTGKLMSHISNIGVSMLALDSAARSYPHGSGDAVSCSSVSLRSGRTSWWRFRPGIRAAGRIERMHCLNWWINKENRSSA